MLTDLALFTGSLALVSVASLVLSTSLERIGVRLHFTQALLGIVTALAADSPEIASSLTALHGGHADLGFGIVLGSNIFNLAALLGLSAIATGAVQIAWRGALFNGVVAITVTAIAALILVSILPGWTGVASLAVVFVPYVILCALGPDRLGWLTSLPRTRRFLRAALAEQHAHEPSDTSAERAATTFDVLAAAPALATIVIGSIWMVHVAQRVGTRLGISEAIIGAIALAALTGIPNLVAALRLARKHRGSVVISEAFNSNTLNIAIGIFLPVCLVGGGVQHLSWGVPVLLVAMTVTAVAMTMRNCGVRRTEGWALVAIYVGFVAMVVASH